VETFGGRFTVLAHPTSTTIANASTDNEQCFANFLIFDSPNDSGL
jgi:hypothetical protein